MRICLDGSARFMGYLVLDLGLVGIGRDSRKRGSKKVIIHRFRAVVWKRVRCAGEVSFFSVASSQRSSDFSHWGMSYPRLKSFRSHLGRRHGHRQRQLQLGQVCSIDGGCGGGRDASARAPSSQSASLLGSEGAISVRDASGLGRELRPLVGSAMASAGAGQVLGGRRLASDREPLAEHC